MNFGIPRSTIRIEKDLKYAIKQSRCSWLVIILIEKEESIPINH